MDEEVCQQRMEALAGNSAVPKVQPSHVFGMGRNTSCTKNGALHSFTGRRVRFSGWEAKVQKVVGLCEKTRRLRAN
jgi:hypothetical protein